MDIDLNLPPVLVTERTGSKKAAWRAAGAVLGEAVADLQEHMDMAAERGFMLSYEPRIIEAVIQSARSKLLNSEDCRPDLLSQVEFFYKLEAGGTLQLGARLQHQAMHTWRVDDD